MTEPDTSPWPGLGVHEPIEEGNRNAIWRGSLLGQPVAIRQSRRTQASLEWELDLVTQLDSLGFTVPTVIETSDGRRHVNGLVVQRWLHGRPPSSDQDWQLVANTLQQLHSATGSYPQRPDCCAVAELTRTTSSVDADMAALPEDVADEVLAVFADVSNMQTSAIHGDPMESNIRIGEDGVVGLLDFDESRVDVAWHDLSNLGCQVLDDASHARALRLSDAWETANAWVAEPDYARQRLAALQARRAR